MTALQTAVKGEEKFLRGEVPDFQCYFRHDDFIEYGGSGYYFNLRGQAKYVKECREIASQDGNPRIFGKEDNPVNAIGSSGGGKKSP